MMPALHVTTPDVDQLEQLRAVLTGQTCVIVGSAPLRTPLAEVAPGECAVCINGAISSVAGDVPLWVLNSKLQDADGKDWPMRPLHRTMVTQGRGRAVGHLALLRGPKYASEQATLGWLSRVGCTWRSWSIIDKPTKLWFEQTACGRRGPDNPCSAGIFVTALAFWLGAAVVRLIGFSFRPGYHYLKTASYRGHVEADTRALKILRRQFGDRLDLSLVPELAA